MIDALVSAYQKIQMGIISVFSGNAANVLDETSFYDVGYMQTQIERIKKELKFVTDALSMQIEVNDHSDYRKQRKTQLMQQRERLLFHMVFLASNSFSNLDSCVKLADGHNWSFMPCVHGLQEYHAGHKDNAFQLLEAYYRQHGKVEEHFLINKVFGLLLSEKGQYQKAIPFLTYALQFIPDDMECLERLKRALVDATLNVGNLSARFTQDVEDLDIDGMNGKQQQPPKEAKPASQKQIALLERLMQESRTSVATLNRHVQAVYGLDDYRKITVMMASELIQKFQAAARQ